MDKEREAVRQRLEAELSQLTFTGQERVLRQTRPPAFRARMSAWWNKELVIPLGPSGVVAAALITAVLLFYAPQIGTREQQQAVQIQERRELIEAGGNTYWKDMYEQAVKRHEH